MTKKRIRKKQVVVSQRSLRTLLEWCNDAIDFKDEADKRAARAFNLMVEQARFRFYLTDDSYPGVRFTR